MDRSNSLQCHVADGCVDSGKQRTVSWNGTMLFACPGLQIQNILGILSKGLLIIRGVTLRYGLLEQNSFPVRSFVCLLLRHVGRRHPCFLVKNSLAIAVQSGGHDEPITQSTLAVFLLNMCHFRFLHRLLSKNKLSWGGTLLEQSIKITWTI